jgi:UDP-glucose 4-epimerase
VNMNMKKKILITGAAGMIGSHLVDYLLEQSGKYKIVAVDDMSVGTEENLSRWLGKDSIVLHQFDVRDQEQLTQLAQGCSALVHLAARKKIGEDQNGVDMLNVNCDGTRSSLEAARNSPGCRYVLGSTSDCYGTSTDLPFKEDGNLLLGPSNVKRWAYAVSKLFDEQLAFAYHKDCGVPVAIVRYFGAFSERSSFTWSGGHVPLFIDAVLKDQKIIIHGDGKQTRSMGYVMDQVVGTALAMEKEEAIGEIINIGNDEEMSVADCAYLVHELCNTGKHLKLEFIEMKELFGNYTDIQRRVPSLEKAQRLLGYAPQWKMIDALNHTIDIHRKRLGA